MQNPGRRVWVFGWMVLVLCAHGARGEEVGRFAIVQNRVTSLKPGSGAPELVVPGATIVLDEQEETGKASAAKMTLGEFAVISIGEATRFKVTRQAVAEATGESVSSISLLVGRARVFVSRFWSGRPEVRVNTPTAVVGIKGSEATIDVPEDGGTIVTVISGSATVRSKGTPSETRDLGPSQQITVLPGGRFAGSITRVERELVSSIRRQTEPVPLPPRWTPEKPATRKPPFGGPAGGPAGWVAAQTEGRSSSGGVMADPPFNVLPEFLVPPQGRTQPFPF